MLFPNASSHLGDADGRRLVAMKLGDHLTVNRLGELAGHHPRTIAGPVTDLWTADDEAFALIGGAWWSEAWLCPRDRARTD